MSISSDEYDRLVELHGTLQQTLSEIESIVEDANPGLHEQWKVYGKHVTNEFVIMGPNLEEVIEKLENDIGTDEEDEEDE